MYVIRWFLLKSCIFGVFISVTEASVLLQTFDGETTYIKGSNVTLVCTITPYNNVMTWYVDNQLYADCFLGNCGPSLNKPYTFTFSFDETAGVFKLNIDSVDSSHAALSFACDDGNVRETISFNVTTDKGQNPSSTTHTSNSPTKPGINNQITVTNEGNGDNNDSSVSEGFIALIVIGILLFIAASICLLVHCQRPKLSSFIQHGRKLDFEWTDRNYFCQWIFRYNFVCTKVLESEEVCREALKKKSCHLENIDEMTIYEINLSRKLCCCCESFAETIYVMTLNASCVADSTTIDVHWTPTLNDVHIKVTCDNEVKVEYSRASRYTITNLSPDKKYQVKVVATFNQTEYILYANDIKTNKHDHDNVNSVCIRSCFSAENNIV